jgi:AbrB family looped-hinge helix DNA binding protein
MKNRLLTDRQLVPTVVTLSSKGQITLPIAFRRSYGIRPGSKVAIEVKNGTMLITPYRAEEETSL